MSPKQALNTLLAIAHERVIDQRASGHTATADGLVMQLKHAGPVLAKLVEAAEAPAAPAAHAAAGSSLPPAG